VHLHLEFGFYHLESRGISVHTAVELSWKTIQDLYQGVTELQQWTQLPIIVSVDSKGASSVESLYQQISSLVPGLLNNLPLKRLDHTLTVEEIKGVNLYFNRVQQLLKLQEQALWETLKQERNPAEKSITTLDAILTKLDELNLKIKQYDEDNRNPLLRRAGQSDDEMYEDLLARLYEFYIPLESSRFIRDRSHTLSRLREDEGLSGDQMQPFWDQVAKESRILRFLAGTLTPSHEALQKASALLHSLAISFGKIYTVSLNTRVSPGFLTKALTTIHGLLQKSLRVVSSRHEDLGKIQKLICNTSLFQTSIQEGIVNHLKLIRKALDSIKSYDEKLLEHLKKLETQPDLKAGELQKLMWQAYEQRGQITSASVFLYNVNHSFSQMIDSFKTIDQTYQKLIEQREQTSQASDLYEAIETLLATQAQCPQSLLRVTQEMIEDETWFIDEVLLYTMREESRFIHEIQGLFKGVAARAQRKQEEQQKIVSSPGGTYEKKKKTPNE